MCLLRAPSKKAPAVTGQLLAGHVSSTSPRWGGFDMSTRKGEGRPGCKARGRGVSSIGPTVSSGAAFADGSALCHSAGTWPANVSKRVASCCETRHQISLTTQCIQKPVGQIQICPPKPLPEHSHGSSSSIPPPLRCPSLFEAAVMLPCFHGAVRVAGVCNVELGHA